MLFCNLSWSGPKGNLKTPKVAGMSICSNDLANFQHVRSIWIHSTSMWFIFTGAKHPQIMGATTFSPSRQGTLSNNSNLSSSATTSGKKNTKKKKNGVFFFFYVNLNCYFSEHMHRFWSWSYLSIITKQPTKLKHSRQEARGQANRLRASISLFRIESLVGHTERQRTTTFMVCVISPSSSWRSWP